MNYESTRGGLKSVSSAEAIKTGIAPDGGLFVPEALIKLTMEDITALKDMTYQQRAVYLLRNFMTDFTEDEISQCVNGAYGNEKFDDKDIAPVRKLNDNIYVLELWHGPTCAFKDMALQILPHMMVKALGKTGETDEIVILVATSGDTGKAALEGFKDVDGTRIIVFFPAEGVSQVQKMQMVTQEGKNTWCVAVQGNFDDAQNGVKAIFSNDAIASRMKENGFKFSSANSINWGRLVPQIVYYFSAYADMLRSGDLTAGEKVNIAVPTGNFGNILAAYYAKEMGLPIHRLICASNDNNVLTDFITSGVYDRNRDFHKTISPSMDILISSNLERLLYEITGHDAEKVTRWMNELRYKGVYTVDSDIRKEISRVFWGGYTNEEETLKTIEYIFNEYGYVVDTHTAVGIDVYDKYVIATGDMTKTIIASTASPFKFNASVASAIMGKEAVEGKSDFELLSILAERCNLDIPKGLEGLDQKEIRHTALCSREDMAAQVEKILNLQ